MLFAPIKFRARVLLLRNYVEIDAVVWFLLARNRGNVQNKIVVIIPKENECRAGAQ